MDVLEDTGNEGSSRRVRNVVEGVQADELFSGVVRPEPSDRLSER